MALINGISIKKHAVKVQILPVVTAPLKIYGMLIVKSVVQKPTPTADVLEQINGIQFKKICCPLADAKCQDCTGTSKWN